MKRRPKKNPSATIVEVVRRPDEIESKLAVALSGLSFFQSLAGSKPKADVVRSGTVPGDIAGKGVGKWVVSSTEIYPSDQVTDRVTTKKRRAAKKQRTP